MRHDRARQRLKQERPSPPLFAVADASIQRRHVAEREVYLCTSPPAARVIPTRLFRNPAISLTKLSFSCLQAQKPGPRAVKSYGFDFKGKLPLNFCGVRHLSGSIAVQSRIFRSASIWPLTPKNTVINCFSNWEAEIEPAVASRAGA